MIKKIEFTGLPAKRVGAVQDYYLVKMGKVNAFLPLNPHRMMFRMGCYRVLNLSGLTPPYYPREEIGLDKIGVNNMITKMRTCMERVDIDRGIIRWTKPGIMLGCEPEWLRFRYDNLMLELDEYDKILLQKVANARPRAIK